MKSLVPWRLGVVAALTVTVGYAVCSLIWFVLMGPSMAFLNALFHGLDFRALYVGGSFEPVGWFIVLVVLSVWAYLLGALFARLWNWFRVEQAPV